MADVEVTTSGPVFDGRAAAVAHRLPHRVADHVGDRTERMVLERLGRVLRHPTGYYESHIRTIERGDVAEVTDGGVVYGPWLEGTGSRNAPVTRFPGYHTFRKVYQDVEARAGELAEPEVRRAVEEMN